MPFDFEIPCASGIKEFSIEKGASIIFIGANGSGKTRLAVHIENNFGVNSHRITAHRALSLNADIPKIKEEIALKKVRYGWEHPDAAISHRSSNRYKNSKPATALVNDFDGVIQALFAQQSIIALQTHKQCRAGNIEKAEATKFEVLCSIWNRLLPHRQLEVSGDDIRSRIPGKEESYSASELSDGERAIFYLIGQALIAEKSSLLIVDEPELHVHTSIISSLWDEIQSARPDCAFLFITHDLNFAASRPGEKYVINSYSPERTWDIEEIPEDAGFSEELTTLILGSRRPILFVEGTVNSLDLAIYRCCYPDWTVIPAGSCEQVIHSVVTLRAHSRLTRVSCAGIVDADDYSIDEIATFNKLGIHPLSVSEVENLVLLPNISRAIAKTESFKPAEIEVKLELLKEAIFETLKSEKSIEDVVARYCRRRIDRILKKIDLSDSNNVEELTSSYLEKTQSLDIKDISTKARDRINNALLNKDLISLLSVYDNKGLIALAASHIKQTKKSTFEAWLTRTLQNREIEPTIANAIKESLPQLTPR